MLLRVANLVMDNDSVNPSFNVISNVFMLRHTSAGLILQEKLAF